jgi:zinc finger CCCH domain-containing protein 14
LVELGTGSQTGYIDDELPDYVMIMVANKRDKDQMKKDLNLFLGSNTGELKNFV